MESEKRTYRQVRRADQTLGTRARLLDAAVAAWRDGTVESASLDAIATRAETTRQTLLRHFGSKDGLIEAAMAERASGIEAARDAVPAGDLDAAFAYLVTHYETDGAVVRRTLAQAASQDVAARIAAHGRAVHRAWVARVLAPEGADERLIDALVIATDLDSWTLLRDGAGRSVEAAERVLRHMVDALLKEAAR